MHLILLVVDLARRIMSEKNIRRLPVIENGKLLGIVTIGDVREAAIRLPRLLSISEV